MECVGLAIRRNLPLLGNSRHCLSILVVGAETFEEGIDDSPLRLAGDDGWVERLWLRAIDENQIRALAVVAATRKGEPKNCHANPLSGA